MSKTVKHTLVVLAVSTFGFSGAALAQMPNFEAVDVNKDGMISPSEAAVLEGLDFGAADVNGDDALSPEEYAAAVAKAQ